MLEQLLEKAGLKYDDLTDVEKETLFGWVDILQKGQLTVEKIKDHIGAMRDAVEQELSKSDCNTKQDLFLKARLRNYLLLDSFLTSPEKARKKIENAISGIVGRK